MNFCPMPDETLEDLQLKGFYILQKKESFRFGMDAVLLSNFVSAHRNQTVLDLGTGTGILPILIAAKTEAKRIVGLEIQPEAVDMAKRSVEGNNLGDRIKIVQGDIRKATELLGASSYDVVVTNPPYTRKGSGLVNPADSKAIARHEICCTLWDVLYSSYLLLKPKGEFYMVHRPDRLADIMAEMRKARLEPKILRMICPREGEPPSLILIKGLKNGNPGLKVLHDLVIYDKEGRYTKEARIQYSMTE